MPIFKMFSKNKGKIEHKVLQLQNDKIDKLEEVIMSYGSRINYLESSFKEMHKLAQYLAQGQQQIAQDLSTIYDSLKLVVESLNEANDPFSDKKSSWGDDDDGNKGGGGYLN